MVFSSLGSKANQVMIHIRGDDKDYKNALKGSDQATSSFASKIKGYAPMIGAAFAAAAVAVTAYSVTAAMKFEQLEMGFNSLAASQGKDADLYIKKLKEMSHNTVSETEIMQKANQAMLLGIDLDTISQMMEGAAVIAQATGQDVGYMFESLALGVGRQSRMLLDNLGIIVKVEEANEAYAASLGKTVSELTDAETKAAFLQATMAGLAERTDALGGYTETAASEMQTLKASASDAAVAFGAELLPAIDGVIGGLNDAGVSGTELGSTLGRIAALPWEIPSGLVEHIKLMKEVKQLNEDGYDTEKELVDLLGLHSSRLAEMTEEEFRLATMKLTAAGYYEKTLMLQNARAHAIKQEIQDAGVLAAIEEGRLATEQAITSETYKQSKAMKAAEKGISREEFSMGDTAFVPDLVKTSDDTHTQALKEQLSVEDHIADSKSKQLVTDQAITAEKQKQSNAMKAAVGGISSSGFSMGDAGVFGETRQSGALTIRPATESEMSSVRSGL